MYGGRLPAAVAVPVSPRKAQEELALAWVLAMVLIDIGMPSEACHFLSVGMKHPMDRKLAWVRS